MLKKRLIGVITVRDGWAVQSFGFRRYLPIGHATWLAENLDRWGADEILLVCIDRTTRNLGPDIDLLSQISNLGLSTPLTYGGGIRDARDAANVIQAGAERLCVDAALRADHSIILEMSRVVGAQAIVASLPVSWLDAGALSWYDYRVRRSEPLPSSVLRLLADGVVSEALLIDWRNEGNPRSFDDRIASASQLDEIPRIVFGGISEAGQIETLLAQRDVVAVGVGNFLSYREHAVQSLKRRLNENQLRPATYGSSW